MKMLARILSLFCVLALCVPAVAQETFHYKLQVLKVDSSVKGKIFSEADWKRLVKSGQAKVLEELTHEGKLNEESLIHVGRKVPIGYKDPRVDSFQVQYVDSGIKLDQTTRKVAPGLYQIDLRPERSTLTPGSNQWDGHDVFIVETAALMKRTQTAVLASWRGVWVPQYFKTTYPNAQVGANDTVAVAITLR